MNAVIGLTDRMRRAFNSIVAHVGRHGAMPSRRMLAREMNCQPTRANVLISSITERGWLTGHPDTGALMAFGSDGVAFFVPHHIAAQLCAHCETLGENPVDVLADAITLHLDAFAPASRQAGE
jgi:hypothetical protein